MRLAYDFIRRSLIERIVYNSRADSNLSPGHYLFTIKRILFNIGQETLRDYFCSFLGSIGKHDHKFINTVPGNNVRTAQGLPQKPDYLPDNDVCPVYSLSFY